jgi:hypothetical protein
LLHIRGEIDHWIGVFLYRDRLIINIDRVVLEGDVHAIIDIDGVRRDSVNKSGHRPECGRSPPPPGVRGIVADPANAPAICSPSAIVKDVVVKVMGIVPNFLSPIAAIFP